MDEEITKGLLKHDFLRYEVAAYEAGDVPEHDVAARSLPDGFDMDGSIKEIAAGGRGLDCWIVLENDTFVVYLPPEDLNWGSKSQTPASGYRPSQEAAEYEWRRWLDRYCKR